MMYNCEVTPKKEEKSGYKTDLDVGIKFRKESFAKDTVEDLKRLKGQKKNKISTDLLLQGLIDNIRV